MSQFDQRKKELDEIKRVLNKFIEKTWVKKPKHKGEESTDETLTSLKEDFNKIYDLLCSTNENNRKKGYKDDNEIVLNSSKIFSDILDKDNLTISYVTEKVVRDIYRRLLEFSFKETKEINQYIYKLISMKNYKDTEKVQDRVLDEWEFTYVKKKGESYEKEVNEKIKFQEAFDKELSKYI